MEPGKRSTVVEVENALHQLPLFGGRGVCRSFLVTCGERFPLSLPRQGSHTLHGAVPVEVERRLDNHEKARADEIDLHLKDADAADAVEDFLPDAGFAVEAAVLGDESRFVAQVERLAITLNGLVITACGVAVLRGFFHYSSVLTVR